MLEADSEAVVHVRVIVLGRGSADGRIETPCQPILTYLPGWSRQLPSQALHQRRHKVPLKRNTKSYLTVQFMDSNLEGFCQPLHAA